ncbi:hypothetical protein [Paenibacillus sp. HB172176]|uniref:hypothetical protein n=1 Tax=Paenibacillus sp. HB172176 TaxID=2493690 RepID=UPI00143BCFCC|nr:hypothetical protein [Paenibacillus sp. HB172176]
MGRIMLEVKLFWSSLINASIFLIFCQVFAVIILQPWHFVPFIQPIHVQLIYEYVFPLVVVFLMSPLFTAETSKETSGWFMSLPYRSIAYFVARWLLSLCMIFALFLGSILVIHVWVLPIPFLSFSFHVLPPALWLGHLALLVSLIGRSYVAGLGAALFYWVTESLTSGAITNTFYLFSKYTSSDPEFALSRYLFIFCSIGAVIFALLLFCQRHYYSSRT